MWILLIFPPDWPESSAKNWHTAGFTKLRVFAVASISCSASRGANNWLINALSSILSNGLWRQGSPEGLYGCTLACYALRRKSCLCIHRKGIAQLQSQFSHSCVYERLYITRMGPDIFLQQNRQTHRGNIYIAHRHMNVENWDCGSTIPFLEIFVSNFLYCVFAMWLILSDDVWLIKQMMRPAGWTVAQSWAAPALPERAVWSCCFSQNK